MGHIKATSIKKESFCENAAKRVRAYANSLKRGDSFKYVKGMGRIEKLAAHICLHRQEAGGFLFTTDQERELLNLPEGGRVWAVDMCPTTNKPKVFAIR